MENKLEQLLNMLIQRGWKPFGYNKGKYSCDNLEINNKTKKMYMAFNSGTPGIFVLQFSLRDICSFESGLWQFVCENGMVNVNETEVYYFWLKRKGTLDRGHYYLSEACGDIRTNNYEFRLIESALKDESELESFILDNIKIEGNDL